MAREDNPLMRKPFGGSPGGGKYDPDEYAAKLNTKNFVVASGLWYFVRLDSDGKRQLDRMTRRTAAPQPQGWRPPPGFLA